PDRRAGRGGALRGAHAVRDRARAHGPPGQARAPRHALMGLLVGSLGNPGRASVAARGGVQVVGASWTLGWWIGGDDRWRLPAVEAAVRQHPVEGTPVVETAMRVPGGDAVQRVYGIGGPGGIVIVEIENASPAPFVVALTIDGARAVAGD